MDAKSLVGKKSCNDENSVSQQKKSTIFLSA